MTVGSPPPPGAAWGCLAVPLVLAFVLWSLWPSADERRHWREITVDLREL